MKPWRIARIKVWTERIWLISSLLSFYLVGALNGTNIQQTESWLPRLVGNFVKNQKKIHIKTKIKLVLNADKSWNFDKSNAENYVFRNISGPNSLRMFFSVPSRGQFLSELMKKWSDYLSYWLWLSSSCLFINYVKITKIPMGVQMIGLVFWKLSFYSRKSSH